MTIINIFGGSSARGKDKAGKSASRFKMPDKEIVKGIMANDEKTWNYIYASMKPGFYSELKKTSSRYKNFISTDDLDDIFIESAVTLMDRVKAGKYKLDKGSLFSYFVMIGWGNIMNLIRSRSTKAKTETIGAGGETTVKASLIPRKTDLASEKDASQEAPYAEDIETEQNAQEKLIDEIFMSLPEKCQRILKLFYWDKKPMDEIAPLVGSKNADTVKAQKSNCMKKAKDIFSSQDPELVETAMGRAAQRAMLSSFIRDRLEMETSEDSGRLAAYSFGNKDVYVYGPEDLDTPLQEIDDLEE